jgi:spore maturation protein SpmB
MLSSRKPTAVNIVKELLKIAVLSSCFAFFGGMGMMAVITEPAQAASATTDAEAYPIVFYQELKNLGGGNYLCEVWTQYRVDATIIKLTASEKAKLQRSYIK